MADKKISALTGASTPLAGTEVLPIVQSGATVKVATDNLTVKNLRSNATSGILQVAGPAAASTRVATVPDANFTVARIDAAQSFTGDQTLSTGNLVIGTSGKGIDFTQDPNPAGMTSELLDDYEEGTWAGVPTFATGAATGVSFTGLYVKIGRQVTLTARWTMDLGTGSGAFTITGLPFTNGASQGNYNGAAIGFIQRMGRSGFTVAAVIPPSGTVLEFKLNDANSANGFADLLGSDISGANTSGATFTITYQV